MDQGIEDVLFEATIESTNYSDFRKANLKWQTNELKPQLVLERLRIPNKKEVVIFADSKGNTGLSVKYRRGASRKFLLSDFKQRIEIKRHPSLLRAFYAIWCYVNPTHERCLSKQLYLVICSLLKRLYLNQVSEEALEKDTAIDFKKAKGIVFSKLYDSIFEVIDNIVRNKNLESYLSVVHELQHSICNQVDLRTMPKPFTLAEVDRVCYHAWIIAYLFYN